MAEDGRPGPERWQHLVTLAFDVQAAKSSGSQAAAAAVESALEVFRSNLDPVEDFEGYAVRRLLLALRECLAAPP